MSKTNYDKALQIVQSMTKEQQGNFFPRLLERFLVLENWRLYIPANYRYERGEQFVSIYDFNYVMQLIRDIAVELALLKMKAMELEEAEG